jgi:hypothetical protein
MIGFESKICDEPGVSDHHTKVYHGLLGVS